MSGEMQSDRLEGEYGTIRQMKAPYSQSKFHEVDYVTRQGDLGELGLHLYSFYVKVNEKTSIDKLLWAFREIYEVTHYVFPNVDSILRRCVNGFSKGFTRTEK